MIPNFSKMMKQAQKMQADMAEAQEKIADLRVEGVSGGGLVRVEMSGRGDVVRVQIDPSLAVAEEVEMLEDLLVAALRDARAKADDLSNTEMQKIMGGMKLPGGMNLPF